MSKFRRVFRRPITRRDSIDDNLSGSGGPLILSPSGTLPRPVIRRVLDPYAVPLQAPASTWRVWGAQPHASLRSVRGNIGGIPDYFFRPSIPLLQAKGFPPPRLTINAPSKVRFCVQRHTRREVLFARKVAGYKHRSPGSGGRYIRRAESSYRC